MAEINELCKVQNNQFETNCDREMTEILSYYILYYTSVVFSIKCDDSETIMYFQIHNKNR